jgi:glycosyltransferase involved in cell wall biosynthesis
MTLANRPSMVFPKPLRVALVQRVCPHWRAPVLARLHQRPEIELTLFHGRNIPGTKARNAEHLENYFPHRELFTLYWTLRAGGRTTPCCLHPTVGWALLRHNPDVILAEGGSNLFTNFLVRLYAALFRKPFIWWTLGELPGRKFTGARRLYRAAVYLLERSAHALLGYSSVALNYFARMGYPAQRCFRAVNCVDTDRIFAEIEQRRELVPALRRRLGLEDRKVVLFVGALTREKEIHRLVQAFTLIRADLPDARLLIVGDGPDRARLEAAVAELGCVDATIFTGQVIDGVSDYFEVADVLVLPSLGGLAISEALAHGVPVICTQADGCEVDLVRNGETGFRLGSLSDEEAARAIAQHLRDLFSAPDRLHAMQEAARTLIQRELNVHTYVAGIMDAIRFAASGRRPRAAGRKR